MNEPGTDLENPAGTAASNETLADLRRLVNLLFASLLICSAALASFLGVQARRASTDLRDLRAKVAGASRELQQQEANDMSAFAKLEEFGRTHPDFEKTVLSKYKVATNKPPVAPKK